jgi:hypothetical protein
MIKFITVLSLFCLGNNTYSQNLLIDELLIGNTEFQQVISSTNDSLKMELIGCLIKKKGDKTVNAKWFDHTNGIKKMENIAKQADYRYSRRLATNQFVALYLISAIYYSNLEFCDKILIEYSDEDGKTKYTTNLKWKACPNQKRNIKRNKFEGVRYKTVDNSVIKEIYLQYEDWYNEAKIKGLKNVKPPLFDSQYKWYKGK